MDSIRRQRDNSWKKTKFTFVRVSRKDTIYKKISAYTH